jgi:hypothetical protein
MERGDKRHVIRSSNERMHRAWERLHPYNFVCLLDVAAGLTVEGLRCAALETLAEFGLCDEMGDPQPLEVIEIANVERHALQELNTRVNGPIRLAIQSTGPFAEGAACRVAVTYRHLFFDGTNSTVFIRRMLTRAVGHRLPSLHRGPFYRGRDWLMANGLRKVPALLGNLLLDSVKMQSVYARGDGTESPQFDAVLVDYSPDLLTRLRREGDRVGATINDVLLARMARAMFAMEASGPGRGRDIAISMAVTLRNGIDPLHPGVCVAVYPVFLRTGGDVLRSVQKQTVRMKRTRSYMRSLIGIGIGSRLWRHPDTGCRASNAYVPSAALTNMRVPATAGDELVTRWRRVVAAGPMAPLLVTALTHSDRLELSLCWRKALFSEREVAVLISSLCE